VRRYVPEAGGSTYPTPIVDHAAERLEALDRWQEAKLALSASAP
jgi:deoxyribodipyrimidine photolyase